MKIIKADTAEIGTCTIGAIILGVGIGVKLFNYLDNYYYLLILIGILIHGLGMYQIHKRAKFSDDKPYLLSNALYWTCWIILIGLVIFIIFKLL
mgnify:CR=1 FL=1